MKGRESTLTLNLAQLHFSDLEYWSGPGSPRVFKGNEGHSWILDSTPWIPDSRYWIPVFVSGTWTLDLNC